MKAFVPLKATRTILETLHCVPEHAKDQKSHYLSKVDQTVRSQKKKEQNYQIDETNN